jgi:hypothetical protein
MSDSGSTQTIEPSTAERRATGRSIGVVVCVVLAVLLTTPALVAFWGSARSTTRNGISTRWVPW